MATPAEAPAPTKRGLLPVVLAVLLAMGAGAGATLVPGSPLYAASPPAAPDAAETGADAPAPDAEFGEFVEMEAIVINPRGTGGRRYLMAKVGVEAATPETLERLGVLGPAARDAILETLSRRSVEELSDISRRDSLKLDIRSALNGILGDDGPVTRVYFTQYVLQ